MKTLVFIALSLFSISAFVKCDIDNIENKRHFDSKNSPQVSKDGPSKEMPHGKKFFS